MCLTIGYQTIGRFSREENDVCGTKITEVLALPLDALEEDMITKREEEVYILPFQHIRRSRLVHGGAFCLLTKCESPI